MRLEFTLAGLLVKLANHYTILGTQVHVVYGTKNITVKQIK